LPSSRPYLFLIQHPHTRDQAFSVFGVNHIQSIALSKVLAGVLKKFQKHHAFLYIGFSLGHFTFLFMVLKEEENALLSFEAILTYREKNKHLSLVSKE
jgi:hypothetical protein